MRPAMTNPIVVILFLLIAAFIALDMFVLHLGLSVFLGKRLVDLIEWVAFWR